jgi:hypothetical protein
MSLSFARDSASADLTDFARGSGHEADSRLVGQAAVRFGACWPRAELIAPQRLTHA